MTWQSQVRAILAAADIELTESADFALRLRHAEGDFLFGDFADASAAEGERARLMAKAADGTLSEEVVGEMLSAEAFERLGREGALPPGLMATWSENAAI